MTEEDLIKQVLPAAQTFVDSNTSLKADTIGQIKYAL